MKVRSQNPSLSPLQPYKRNTGSVTSAETVRAHLFVSTESSPKGARGAAGFGFIETWVSTSKKVFVSHQMEALTCSRVS
jgi:hypothetical protein